MSAIFIAIVVFGLFGAAVFVSGFIVAVRETIRERRDATPEREWADKGRYGWSAFFAVFASAVVIALAGVNPLWIYAGPLLAIVTAIGGGTIRDLLIARFPMPWLTDPAYLVTMTASAVGTMVYARFFRPPAALLLVADALGLALFSVAGAQIAQHAGVPAIGCIALGTVTGSAGGALRDVLTNEIPLVLKRGDLYASAAIIGVSIYFLLEMLGVGQQEAALSGIAVVASVRLAAIWWRLRLPVFELNQ